jgi:hypothetical protein
MRARARVHLRALAAVVPHLLHQLQDQQVLLHRPHRHVLLRIVLGRLLAAGSRFKVLCARDDESTGEREIDGRRHDDELGGLILISRAALPAAADSRLQIARAIGEVKGRRQKARALVV